MAEVLVADNGTDRLPQLLTFLSNLGHNCTIVETENLNTVPEPDLMVLSGGIWSPSRTEMVTSFIRRTNAPGVGICLGFLQIVEAAGGAVSEVEKSHGLTSITINGRPGHKVFEDHTLGVVNVPKGFRAVATSVTGVEAIISERFCAVQFHPEVEHPQNHGSKLVSDLLEQLISNKTVH